MPVKRAAFTYYNEIEDFAASWLEVLIARRLVADGWVDRRPIQQVEAADLQGFTQHHFFAGIGGWSYALRLAGWPDDKPVWTGSCPCQPFSTAGKQQGNKDARHLWPFWKPLIAKCAPSIVFGEQVASKLGREWFSGVRADLEALEYAIGVADLCAASVGAPHPRQRLLWVADSNIARSQGRQMLQRRRASERFVRSCGGKAVRLGNTKHRAAHSYVRSQPKDSALLAGSSAWAEYELVIGADGCARRIESGLVPVADGIPARVGRVRGYGNAIVPQVAAAFIKASQEAIERLVAV